MDEEEEEMDEEEEDVVVRDLKTQFNEEGWAMELQEDGFEEEEEDEAQAVLVQEQQILWWLFEGTLQQAAHGAGALGAEHFAALYQRMTQLMEEMEGDHSPEVSAALQQELEQVWAQMEVPAPLLAPMAPAPAALVLPAPPAPVAPAPPAVLEPWEQALDEPLSFGDLDFLFEEDEEEQQHEA